MPLRFLYKLSICITLIYILAAMKLKDAYSLEGKL